MQSEEEKEKQEEEEGEDQREEDLKEEDQEQEVQEQEVQEEEEDRKEESRLAQCAVALDTAVEVETEAERRHVLLCSKFNETRRIADPISRILDVVD